MLFDVGEYETTTKGYINSSLALYRLYVYVLYSPGVPSLQVGRSQLARCVWSGAASSLSPLWTTVAKMTRGCQR